MRTYGRKQLKRYVDRATRAKTETRDAIIWDVIEEDRVCQVKIQGSNEFIYAHYPRNQTTVPKWCKVGNAVRIIHKGGNRGYMEIAGEGRAAPTGSGTPTIPTPSNALMSGMAVWATMPTNKMAVTIDSGNYRIDGTIYSYGGTDTSSYYVMDTDPIIMDDDPVQMNTPIGAIVIETAPAVGYYRYDAIVIGEDGIVDVIKGIEVTANPVYPTVTESHILLIYMLVVGGVTAISQGALGQIWTTPRAVMLATISDPTCESMAYWPEDVEPIQQPVGGLIATLSDQYDNPFPCLWTATFTLHTICDGVLFASGTGQGIAITVSTNGSSITVIYRKPLIGGSEFDPIIYITIAELPEIKSTAVICLHGFPGL